MPGRKSKYSTVINGQIKTELFSVLSQATEEDLPSTDWIQSHNIFLSSCTPQKLSRSLNEMVDMGFVKKAKGKNGRMIYRLLGELNCNEENDSL